MNKNIPKQSPLAQRQMLILALFAACSLAVYLGTSAQTYRLGFPLDDSWIYQTYARNLALLGEWAYVPGQPSGGATGPLWAGL